MSGSDTTWPGARESELESEFEHEFETEGESEAESEAFLGGIGSALSGLLGEGESIAESEFEAEFESEFESEQFFGGLGKLFKKIAPVLKRVAKVAAPLVGTAILGPAGGALGKIAASALGESEFEAEFEFEAESEAESEFEFESETEFASEGEAEAAHEIASHPMTEHEALAEMMAEAASHAMNESEAEAMAGAAVITVLSPRDRRALSSLLPDLLRGAAVLTRILRRHRATRPAVRVVPAIMRRSVRSLKRHAAAGRPITKRTAARATAREVRKVLGSPRLVRASAVRNMRASRAIRRSGRSHRAVAG
jgi:hypothetical protein